MPDYKGIHTVDGVTVEFVADNDYEALKHALKLCDAYVVRCTNVVSDECEEKL